MKPYLAAMLIAALPLWACSSKVPEAPLARADQAIQSAASAGADRHATLDMRIAREKLAAARSTDDETRSRRLSDEAVASAELAQAKTEAARSVASLQDLGRTSVPSTTR
jgi:hypothetical protein